MSDLIPNNPLIAKVHLKQLLFSLNYNLLKFDAIKTNGNPLSYSFIDNKTV